MGSDGHRPALDGVRGLAILLVLGQHAMTRPLIDGFVGVTVFFCLSGYLITTLLLRELESGSVDLRAFYRRRVARLMPGLAAVVVVTFAILLLIRHDLTAGLAFRRDLAVGQVAAPAVAAVTYSTSLFDWAGHPFATYDYFNYTWSLSVEEQFYLLWPLVLLVGYRRHRGRFTTVAVGLVAATLVLDLYLGLSRTSRYDPHEYFGSDTNALPILVGCLLALVVANRWLSRTLRVVAPWAPLAVVSLFVLAAHDDTARPALVIVMGTALTALLLTGVELRPRSLLGTLMSRAEMRWLGERSYSIYLWNVLARIAILSWLGHTLVGDVVWLATVVVLAELSYRLVERPLRARLSPRTRDPRPDTPLAEPLLPG